MDEEYDGDSAGGMYGSDNNSGGSSMSGGSGLIGGIIGAIHNRDGTLSGRESQDRDRQAQYDFAQNSIQWRVADAEAAGIHPLFALGAQTQGFSPVGPAGGADTSYASDIGAGIDSMINKDATDRALDRQEELQDAQMNVLRSEADRNDSVTRSNDASIVSRAAAASKVNLDTRELNDSKHFSVGTGNDPLIFPKGRSKAQEIEDYFGDAAAEVELFPTYVQQKADRIGTEYKEYLEGLFDNFHRKFGGSPKRTYRH